MKLPEEKSLRKITSIIVTGQSILLFGGAIFLVVESFISEAKNFDALIAEIFFALLGGIGLLIAANAIRSGKRYGNSPALLANLIALAVSYYIFDGGWPAIAIPLALFAFIAIIGILMITAQSAKTSEE